MYSGLLPRGLTEDDLSPDDEENEDDAGEEKKTEGETWGNSRGINSSSAVEAPSTHAASDADGDSLTCSLPGVSQDMWQKFQELRKKKEEMKALQLPRKRKRRRRHKQEKESEEPAETRVCQEDRQKHWDELKQYFGVNDRFDPPACSVSPAKSSLEKSIETAIAEGDIAKAEEMSDRLATRELGVTIAKAVDCRDFVQRKQEEDALKAAQKRKNQIAWGFEAKKRWESKSNMGFM